MSPFIDAVFLMEYYNLPKRIPVRVPRRTGTLIGYLSLIDEITSAMGANRYLYADYPTIDGLLANFLDGTAGC